MDQKLKIGVLGAGHLGKIHLRLLQESSAYELVGFYDSQPQIAAKISREFGYRSFSDVNSLFDEVDVIDIVTPTLSHFVLAKKALESGLHIFLEKPITANVTDIDAILSVVNSKVTDVQASGVSIISETPDIANARLQFENGCVANLTASRISMKTMRKSRFFQRDAYVSVDFFEKKVEVVRMENEPESPDDFAMILENAEGVKKQIFFDNLKVDEGNAILMELENFADAIRMNKEPAVSLQAGASALEVAYQIINCF